MALEGPLAKVAKSQSKIGWSSSLDDRSSLYNQLMLDEQLDTIDKQRIRAVEAKDLTQRYIDFNAGNTSRLDEIMNSGPDSEYSGSGARKIANKKVGGLPTVLDLSFDDLFVRKLIATLQKRYRRTGIAAETNTGWSESSDCSTSYTSDRPDQLTEFENIESSPQLSCTPTKLAAQLFQKGLSYLAAAKE
ncbi:hypothetical protein BJ742DRAFT_897542 [Cladochytrium replicatum]|nr:hypothetical protein BJ742DRAFT_897542 [Cladochytrium replicatum]